jgi:hypothetical protein
MSFHIRDEVLSAYLDGEIEPARERSVDDHVASCEECRARLAALRGVMLELRRAPRLQPPPVLAHQIRQQAMEQAPLGAFDSLRAFLAGLPLHPGMRTVMAMGLALALSVSLIGIEREQRLILPAAAEPTAEEPITEVEVIEGMTIYKKTTSRVGDLDFVFNEQGVWVQEGLEGSEPETRVDSRSPEGRALTQRTDIDLLLEDGHSVVLSSEDGRTVELAPPPLRGASFAWPSARA